MNKMLDKEDFTMMKRAIFATQVRRCLGSFSVPGGEGRGWLLEYGVVGVRMSGVCPWSERGGSWWVGTGDAGSQDSWVLF